ncbi:MAG: hypothetical protein A2161_10070 [Candidatus Schekmanbacteria bacterium RBG_13_48_7]|uniref:Lipoprotein n=1 Tax=Candidatus Schekmanbacteria bacterium RBG_13_48_7 TaxID=1817878 RepID=A0A1F7S0K3_9BACT|nr:MAG: hypothetical protein A2161_10070 [Candidatus Schekmanbacteria bacterium RBG_13_48_7]
MRILFYTIFFIILLGCQSSAGDWQLVDQIVVVIGDEALCKSELNAYIEFFRPEYPPPENERDSVFMKEALDELIKRKLGIEFFKKLFVPIFLPNSLVTKQILIQERFSDEGEFDVSLRKNGFTPLTLGEWIKDDYILTLGINRRYGLIETGSMEVEEFLKDSEEKASPLWNNWLAKLPIDKREEMAADILQERKISEKLKDLSTDLMKQTRIQQLMYLEQLH